MSDETYLGSETLPAEGLYEKPSYKITARCDRCQHEYHWVTKRLSDDNKPCPRKSCREAALQERIQREAYNLAKMLEEQRAPGHIGESLRVKAIDTTAETVMADYQMSDLKDNLRVGDTMAPRLPSTGPSGMPMATAAENFFAPQNGAGRTQRQKQAQLLGRRALAGAFKGMAVSPAQVLGGNQGETPLRLVGNERLRDK